MSEEEIVQGDKRIGLVLVGTLMLVAALWAAQFTAHDSDGAFDTLESAEDTLDSTLERARLNVCVGLILNIGFAGYFGTFGTRVIQSRTSPPPGWRLPWSVRIKRGKHTQPIGYGCIVVSLLFLARAVSLVYTLRVLS